MRKKIPRRLFNSCTFSNWLKYVRYLSNLNFPHFLDLLFICQKVREIRDKQKLKSAGNSNYPNFNSQYPHFLHFLCFKRFSMRTFSGWPLKRKILCLWENQKKLWQISSLRVYGKDPAREMLNQFWFPEKSPVNSQQLENRDLVTVIIFTLVSNKKVI